jgi:hypothetical protein
MAPEKKRIRAERNKRIAERREKKNLHVQAVFDVVGHMQQAPV